MDEPNNADQVKPAPRVGLIAGAEGVRRIGPVAVGSSLEIVAQAGMKQPDALPEVEWFDDARVMIAQSGVEALILATSPRAAVELDQMAADHGLPVWRLPPLGRNFAEAAELVTRLRQRETPYRVASWWEAVAEDVRWGLCWREGFKPLHSDVRVSAAGPALQSWRASLADAPGGVLATDAYGMLEALVAVRELPERVLGSIAQARRRSGEAPRETEGVGLAILRYESEATTVAVHATWDIHPFGQSTQHHGAELTVALEPEQVAVRGSDGELLAERRRSPEAFLDQEMERFVAMVRDPAGAAAQDASLERHLAVTALLEAIYLSARTGQPESPRKFYEVQGWPEPRW